MRPIYFKEQNIIFGKDQPGYLPLPANIKKDKNGEAISCWKMSWKERLCVLITGRVYLSLWTFNNPLQPQRLEVFKSKLTFQKKEK